MVDCTNDLATVHACQVSREDRKGLTAKQVACVPAAIDAAGYPTTTVPLVPRKR